MKNKCHKCRQIGKTQGKPHASQPLKRCAALSCAELIPSNGVRFCAEHVPKVCPRDRSEYHRANKYFYSSARWRGFRKWFLRQFPICSDTKCTAPATDVDHIKAIEDGGEKFDSNNCQSLCHSCHSIKTRTDQLAGRRTSAHGEGGVKTYSSNRILPHVKLKKCVRRFWARGVSDRAQIEDKGANLNEKRQKATDMIGGSGPRGERGE